jgi:hypothetical protein
MHPNIRRFRSDPNSFLSRVYIGKKKDVHSSGIVVETCRGISKEEQEVDSATYKERQLPYSERQLLEYRTLRTQSVIHHIPFVFSHASVQLYFRLLTRIIVFVCGQKSGGGGEGGDCQNLGEGEGEGKGEGESEGEGEGACTGEACTGTGTGDDDDNCVAHVGQHSWKVVSKTL